MPQLLFPGSRPSGCCLAGLLAPRTNLPTSAATKDRRTIWIALRTEQGGRSVREELGPGIRGHRLVCDDGSQGRQPCETSGGSPRPLAVNPVRPGGRRSQLRPGGAHLLACCRASQSPSTGGEEGPAGILCAAVHAVKPIVILPDYHTIFTSAPFTGGRRKRKSPPPSVLRRGPRSDLGWRHR